MDRFESQEHVRAGIYISCCCGTGHRCLCHTHGLCGPDEDGDGVIIYKDKNERGRKRKETEKQEVGFEC